MDSAAAYTIMARVQPQSCMSSCSGPIKVFLADDSPLIRARVVAMLGATASTPAGLVDAPHWYGRQRSRAPGRSGVQPAPGIGSLLGMMGALLAIPFAFLGAYAGMALRRLLLPPTSGMITRQSKQTD